MGKIRVASAPFDFVFTQRRHGRNGRNGRNGSRPFLLYVCLVGYAKVRWVLRCSRILVRGFRSRQACRRSQSFPFGDDRNGWDWTSRPGYGVQTVPKWAQPPSAVTWWHSRIFWVAGSKTHGGGVLAASGVRVPEAARPATANPATQTIETAFRYCMIM